MTVSILIPFRGDNGQRDRLWAHCKTLWERLPVELVIGEESGKGPFNIAQAFNNAATKATGNIYLYYGADILPDPERIHWATQQLETHKWCALYSESAEFSPTSTNAILAGALPETVPPGERIPKCTGMIAVRADAWFPMDERFQGWGYEDTAYRAALTALYGPTPVPDATCRALYHDKASHDQKQANRELYAQYKKAAADGTMRELIGEIL